MATHVKWFRELARKDEKLAGHKAAHLGEMLNAGFPVPNGFVVLPSAFQDGKLVDDAREEVEAAYSMLDANHELHNVKLARLIGVGRDLPFVAVRCSGKSVQNVKGNNNLLNAIKELSNKNPAAMIVQKQVNSEKCGTIVTNENEIDINAIYGLGGVAPIDKQTSYIVNKKSGKFSEMRLAQDFFVTRDEFNRVVKKNLADSQRNSSVLAENEINVLSRLAQKAESHYKSPQKLSWAIERGKVFLLQAEPAELKSGAKAEKQAHGFEINDDISAGLGFFDAAESNVGKESVIETARLETKMPVLVSLSNFETLEALKSVSDGIGLLKVHKINSKNKINVEKYLRENRLDEYETTIYRCMREIVSQFKGKPATIRVSNLPELLKPEFSAIRKLHSEGFTKIHIALPMVVSADEIKKAKEMLREVWFGDKSPVIVPVEFGICVETPASVLVIEYLCREGIDFVHINTNDLAKTILLSDRKKSAGGASHPAVLRAVEHVIKVCKSHGVKIIADVSDANVLEKLIGWGIDAVSTNENFISAFRKNISELELMQL